MQPKICSLLDLMFVVKYVKYKVQNNSKYQ